MPKKFTENGAYTEIITKQEALDHLSLDSDTHGTIVEDYIKASIISAEEKLQRSLVTHTIVHTRKTLKRDMHLLMPPVKAVSSLKYYDEDGVQQTIAAENYNVELAGDNPGIRLKESYSIPSVSCDFRFPVEITYTTGPESGAEAENRNSDTKAFVKIILGTLWSKRDAFAESATIDDMIKFALKFIPKRRLFRF
jgi:hypothetical protein